MAMGMDLMMKSFGIDPKEVMQSIEGFKAMAVRMEQRQTNVDEKLDLIIAILHKRFPEDFEHITETYLAKICHRSMFGG